MRRALVLTLTLTVAVLATSVGSDVVGFKYWPVAKVVARCIGAVALTVRARCSIAATRCTISPLPTEHNSRRRGLTFFQLQQTILH